MPIGRSSCSATNSDKPRTNPMKLVAMASREKPSTREETKGPSARRAARGSMTVVVVVNVSVMEAAAAAVGLPNTAASHAINMSHGTRTPAMMAWRILVMSPSREDEITAQEFFWSLPLRKC